MPTKMNLSKDVKDSNVQAPLFADETARLTNENAMMKHKLNELMKLYEEGLTYKMNLVAFLMKQGLYQEWQEYYTNLR